MILAFRTQTKYKLPSSKCGFVGGEEGRYGQLLQFVCEALIKENPLFLSSQKQACIRPVYLHFRATTGSKGR